MNKTLRQTIQINIASAFRSWGWSAIVMLLTWQIGCQHNLAPRSNIRIEQESNAAGQRNAQQVFPDSTMPGAMGTAAIHSGGPTACTGACCQSRAYQPAFPEFNRQAVQPANCQEAPFQYGALCSPPYQPRYIDTQEYVYDGGDRDPQARLREDLTVVGLDSEDTVIRFETQSGSVELQSGCRVPIYAPRFAATRKITPLGTSDRVVAIQATNRDERIGRMADAIPPTKTRLRSGPMLEDSVHVVEAVRERNRGVLVDKIIPAIGVSEAFRPYEDLQIIRDGRLTSDDKVNLRRFTLAALNWSSVEELVVLVDGSTVQIAKSSSRPEEVFTYELDGKPRVRICKVASHQVAEPGDTIDFTIRFDNIGDQKISNIVVHDSLSPRLEYVDDSQKTSLNADFQSEANDAGSNILTWSFGETIRPGEGGYIRFQCKVR
ncbi:MAG: DUF11 domain-containing protein [Pirellulaceae bacterium]|nr:DUF11 domain-containing protein [Pirellulaceae bacterium]